MSNNDDTANEFHVDDYGTGYNAIRMHKGRGTESAPANLVNGDVIGALEFIPRFGSTFGSYINGSGLATYYEGDGSNNLTSLRFYTSGNMPNTGERMRITADGNVGIGTTTPHAPLQFANVESSRKIVLFERNGTNTNNDNQFFGFGINLNTLRYQVDHPTSDHVFYAGNGAAASNELMRIKGDGNVGIGTTSPSQKLHVIGNILASGTITPSDIRIKKDIVDNSYGLKEVLALRTINYRYKDESLSKDKKVGFIAQEIKAAMPELVTTANDEIKTLGVNYAEMTVVLTKAVQQQQDMIKKQEDMIKNQEGMIKKQQVEIDNLKAEMKEVHKK